MEEFIGKLLTAGGQGAISGVVMIFLLAKFIPKLLKDHREDQKSWREEIKSIADSFVLASTQQRRDAIGALTDFQKGCGAANRELTEAVRANTVSTEHCAREMKENTLVTAKCVTATDKLAHEISRGKH